MPRSTPIRLDAILETALARLGLDRSLDDYRIWQAWDEVVGRVIARNAQPVRLDGKRLVVTVRNSSWLQELSMLQGDLVARLNEWMEREVVRDLFLVVGKVDYEEKQKPESEAPVRPRRGSMDASAEESELVTPGMNQDIAAAFERLWHAARSRKDEAEEE